MKHPTYLIHYGIPGQKWGVRRFQNEDGTYTEEGKDRRRFSSDKVRWKDNEYQDSEGKLTKKGYLKLDLTNQDNIFKKGTKVSRVSQDVFENIKNVRKYVSLQDEPEEKWKKLFSESWDVPLYKHQYEVVKNIRVSSIKVNVREFNNLVNSNETFKKTYKDAIDEMEKKVGPLGRTGKDEDDYFKAMALPFNEANRIYQKHMKDLGYDAIADKYGIESGADRSIILLDPDHSVKLRRVSSL